MMGKNPGNSKGPGGRLWPGLGQLVPAGWVGGSRPLSPASTKRLFSGGLPHSRGGGWEEGSQTLANCCYTFLKFSVS